MRDTSAKRRFRPLPLAAAIAIALVPATSQAVTYVVTSPLDNSGNNPTVGAGTGTLRQAIIDANANCPSDPTPIIAFAIGVSPTFIGIGSPAPTTINPLPAFTCATAYTPTVDGTTQPGSVVNTDPTGFNGTFGILLDGSGMVATGGGCGFTSTSGSLIVRGIEFNGFTAAGASAGMCGVNLQVYGSKLTNNTDGVKVVAGGTAIIGDFGANDRNYIAFNTFGVNIVNANTVNVVNNFIGTGLDGNSPAPNGTGVVAQNIPTLQINGNVISGNSAEGIRLNAAAGLILNNQIGLGSLGAIVPNQTGIRTDNSSTIVDIFNNTIAHNNTYGVHVASGVSVRMTMNSITANLVKNVTLDMLGGPVPNDFQDLDGGPNSRQNFPVVSAVTPSGPNTVVTFAFNSVPLAGFDLDFYSNSGPGIPGGQTYLATTTVTVNSTGDSPVTSVMLAGAPDFISMTARIFASEDTSEFSPIVAAAAAAPAVTVSPPNLAFGNVAVNTTSPNQTATLTSTGTAPWQISQFSTGSCYGGPICYGGAEFTCMTDCVPFTPYAPAAFCTLTANFQPTFLGPQTLNLVVCDNTTGSPQTIVLSGTGVPPPTLTVTPSFFDFGDVPVGTTSRSAFFTVQNPGASPVAFTAATNGPFAILRTNCQNPIPGGGSCDHDVAFLPDTAGIASGNFLVRAGPTQTISNLMGNGIVAPALSLPSSIDILYELGSPPATQTVVLTNSGLATLDITSITIAGTNFTLVDRCPRSLPPRSSCDLVIGFSATSLGTFDGTLTVISNAPGGSAVIPIRGLSQPRNVAFLEVTPKEIGYGSRALGTTTEGEKVTIRNVGGAPAVFNSLVATVDFVILSHNCTAPLRTLESCEAFVAMRPLSYGTRFGALRILSNAENNPTEVNIFGTSCRTSGHLVPRIGGTSGCTP